MEEAQVNAACAIARLDSWLQTMRGPGGFTGPISHWWESSLLYCGPMADWRYEGILCGYTTLYRSTGQALWLERAKQAGDDLAAAQLPSGNYRTSAFQQGPMEGGTPHEAAADVGLMELAGVLRESGEDSWQKYYETARRNIEEYLIGELWNGQGFRDQPWNSTLVPNKNATTIEALVLYETLSGRDMSEYLDRAAAVILAAQEQNGPRAGATVHLGTGPHRLAIGIYTARSMCGLLQMYERRHHDAWLQAVQLSLEFLRNLYSPYGLLFGRYPDGTFIANPRLIAASGDVLRLMIWSRKYGLDSDEDVDALVEVLVKAQLPSGSIPTGYGFAQRGGRRAYHGPPEFRDVLPVVGWCDKAFRALALFTHPTNFEILHTSDAETRVECIWKGRPCVFHENNSDIEIRDARTNQAIYHWSKGECYPSIYRL